MLVNIQKFIDTYMSAIPEKLFVRMLNKQIDGITDIEIDDAVVAKIKAKREKEKEAERKLNECAEMNNRGMELEAEGRIDEAILIYEENISSGYPAAHSFDRLMILYRRTKDYKNEIRIIKKAIRIFAKYEKYIERLNKRLVKVSELLEKSHKK